MYCIKKHIPEIVPVFEVALKVRKIIKLKTVIAISQFLWLTFLLQTRKIQPISSVSWVSAMTISHMPVVELRNDDGAGIGLVCIGRHLGLVCSHVTAKTICPEVGKKCAKISGNDNGARVGLVCISCHLGLVCYPKQR